MSAEVKNAVIVCIVCDRGDRYLVDGDFPCLRPRAARAAQLSGIIGGMLLAACAYAQQIALTIERIDGPSLARERITGTLRAAATTTLDLQVDELSVAGDTWRNVRLACPDLKQERDQLVCAEGTLETPVKIPLSFRYATLTRNLDIALRPAANEEWRLTLESGAASPTLTLAVSNGALTRLNAWWPAGWPKPNAGSVSGKADVQR